MYPRSVRSGSRAFFENRELNLEFGPKMRTRTAKFGFSTARFGSQPSLSSQKDKSSTNRPILASPKLLFRFGSGSNSVLANRTWGPPRRLELNSKAKPEPHSTSPFPAGVGSGRIPCRILTCQRFQNTTPKPKSKENISVIQGTPSHDIPNA